MATLEHDGITLHYEVHGVGHPVVLVHGLCVTFAANFGMFGWIETLNAAGLQVIGLDCRGHGQSGKPTEPSAYGTAKVTGDVLALVDHLGLQSPALVGYSIGSLYALDLAHRHPERWSRVVLCATGDALVGAGSRDIEALRRDLMAAVDREERPRDLPKHFALYWTFATNVSGDRRAAATLMRGTYPTISRDDTKRISARMLVVSGEQDQILGQGPTLAASIPGARYLEIPGADHFTLATEPKVQAEIAAFLATA